MNVPTFLIGLLLSTLYGSAFHLLRGGNAGKFLLYLFLGWIGFWGGHFLATQVPLLTFGSIGALHAGIGTLASLVLLFFGHWLSKVEMPK
jgi:hypothetical protein